MAGYTGMKPRRIIETAMLFAKKNGFEIIFSEGRLLFDEAVLWVTKDIFEADFLYTDTWPASNEVAMVTNEILHPQFVFGDSKLLTFVPYEQYRRMFLGDESQKPSGDSNFYWTILGRSIFVEPDVEDFTNINIQYVKRHEEQSSVDLITEVRIEYQMLISYKICEWLAPSQLRALFLQLYKDAKKEMISYKNKLYATGHVKYWDIFEGGKRGRASGWPGKIEADS